MHEYGCSPCVVRRAGSSLFGGMQCGGAWAKCMRKTEHTLVSAEARGPNVGEKPHTLGRHRRTGRQLVIFILRSLTKSGTLVINILNVAKNAPLPSLVEGGGVLCV